MDAEMKDANLNLPRPSQIIEIMKIGRQYKSINLARKFEISATEMTPILRAMSADGAINSVVQGKDRCYFIPSAPKVAGPAVMSMYRAEAKPLSDAMSKAKAAFVTGCMAVRRS